MRWMHAAVYVALAAVLAVADFATRRPPTAPLVRTAGEPSRVGADIVELVVESGGHRVRAVRDDGPWQVREPADAAVPADLIDALVSAVLNTPAEAVSAGSDRSPEFGLEAPATRLTFTRRDAAPVTLAIGARNPAETGVYARLEGNPQIVLMGLNAEYYIKLLLRGAYGGAGTAG